MYEQGLVATSVTGKKQGICRNAPCDSICAKRPKTNLFCNVDRLINKWGQIIKKNFKVEDDNLRRIKGISRCRKRQFLQKANKMSPWQTERNLDGIRFEYPKAWNVKIDKNQSFLCRAVLFASTLIWVVSKLNGERKRDKNPTKVKSCYEK